MDRANKEVYDLLRRGGILMNCFNEKEFENICDIFHVIPKVEEKTIKYADGSFFNKMKRSVQNDRRCEVVFCVIRPSGKIITVTCNDYPSGIYRIPTGGIGYNEDIVTAVYRETREELGLDVEISKFAGVIKIRFEHGNEHVMFYSYLFILKETGGKLLIDASDDEVSEVMEVDVNGLEKISNSLADIHGRWRDWGKFRHVTTNAVYEYLKQNM